MENDKVVGLEQEVARLKIEIYDNNKLAKATSDVLTQSSDAMKKILELVGGEVTESTTIEDVVSSVSSYVGCMVKDNV